MMFKFLAYLFLLVVFGTLALIQLMFLDQQRYTDITMEVVMYTLITNSLICTGIFFLTEFLKSCVFSGTPYLDSAAEKKEKFVNQISYLWMYGQLLDLILGIIMITTNLYDSKNNWYKNGRAFFFIIYVLELIFTEYVGGVFVLGRRYLEAFKIRCYSVNETFTDYTEDRKGTAYFGAMKPTQKEHQIVQSKLLKIRQQRGMTEKGKRFLNLEEPLMTAPSYGDSPAGLSPGLRASKSPKSRFGGRALLRGGNGDDSDPDYSVNGQACTPYNISVIDDTSRIGGAPQPSEQGSIGVSIIGNRLKDVIQKNKTKIFSYEF